MRVHFLIDLQVADVPFPSSALDEWENGNYGLLYKLPRSSFVRRILHEKIHNRSNLGRRFFGETFVATHLHPAKGWYGSFKWLSSWPARNRSSYAMEYRAALEKHFPHVAEISSSDIPLRNMLGGKKPVPPDLWMIVGGDHQFIEVKLPRDPIGPTQIAGLAMIATCLKGSRPVSVWIYNLHPEGTQSKPLAASIYADYSRFCSICKTPKHALADAQ